MMMKKKKANPPLYDKDGKLTSNEAIRLAVIKKITELENLRAQEQIASTDLMAKNSKLKNYEFDKAYVV